MYNHNQQINYPNHYSDGADVNHAAAPVDPIADSQGVSYDESHSFENGDGVGYNTGVASAIDAGMSYAGDSNTADQLTLSFGGQVYVFDTVTAEKVSPFYFVFEF